MPRCAPSVPHCLTPEHPLRGTPSSSRDSFHVARTRRTPHELNEFNESIHSPHHSRWVNSLIGVFPLGNDLNETNDEPVTYATASRIDEGGEIVAASRAPTPGVAKESVRSDLVGT